MRTRDADPGGLPGPRPIRLGRLSWPLCRQTVTYLPMV